MRGALRPTARLVELVTARLGNLSEPERHALELTALGEPLAQPALDQLADTAAIESLEDRGLIASRMDGRRLQVALAHPVYGDVVRSGISPRRERVLARELAEASGSRRQDDTLLLASLRLVGGGGSPDLLLAGAKAARDRRDYALTERMARAAIDNGEGFEARLLAAEAAHLRGRHEQAALELTALARDAAVTSERVQVALLCFDHEFFTRGTADIALLDALLDLQLDPLWHDELRARRLCLDRVSRGPGAVVDTVGPLQPLPEVAGAPRTSLHAVLGGCLTRTGRIEQALVLLVPPSGPTVRQGSTVQSEPWSPFGSHALALIGLGRLGEAEELLARVQEDLSVHPGSPESAVVAASLGALRLEQGRVQTAFLQAASAAAVFLDLGAPGLRPLVCGRVRVRLGAGRARAQSQPRPSPRSTTSDCRRTWSTRWRCCRRGRGHGPPAATWSRRARTSSWRSSWAGRSGTCSGPRGLCTDSPAWAGPGRSWTSSAALASRVDGELTAARLSYARAAADQDSGALAAAAARFEGLGALLYAAEALGEAAVHLRRDGASREAAATQQTAARLLARCEGAVTPFVRAIGARAQLTPAELDTALQAATGSTDKQIAEMMHLSVRTVENRLHRAYQKLGLSHRRELAEALRDLPGI